MITFKDKNVLVTGGTGMIGRQLVDLLINEGAIVTVVSLDEPIGLPKEVKFIFADLRNPTACEEACQNQNYVFNLIGVKGSPKMCMEQPADFFVPMMQFNTNMMHAAFKADVDWYLYTSSVGVYQPAPIFYEDDVWKTMPSKNDWYAGWAKRMGELQADVYRIQHKWNRVSIVRPANVYGPFDNFDPENAMVIPSLVRKACENNILEVWGDGSPVRDFIHSRDVALGMIHAVKNKITLPLNLGSGNGVSIKKIVDVVSDLVSEKLNKNVVVAWDTSKPKGDAIRILDMKRAESFGFKTSVSLQNGIKETLDWFVENKNIIDKRYNSFK